MTVGGAGMTVNVTARPAVMEPASVDSGLRRNDGWGAGMTVNVTARPTVMEAASVDSGLRRNDGWGVYEMLVRSLALNRFRLAPE